MNRILICLLLCLFVLIVMPNNTYAIEFYNTVYVEGIAPIIIDGDLSDWAGINLQVIPLTYYQSLSEMTQRPSDADLSASFKCFADIDYVYSAVSVRDDKVIIGNHPFGEGWNDDSIEIYYNGDLKNTSKPYFNKNDVQIRIVGNPRGMPYLDGNIPYFYITQIPYYWEARGVRCGFKQNENGYTVEVAVPLEVLGLKIISPNSSIGMNVIVLEDDNEENGELCDSFLSWLHYDPQKTSWWETECYNRIIFTQSVKIPGMIKNEERDISAWIISNNSAWELKLNLNAPNNIGFNEVITSVLTDIANSDWNTAANKVEPIKDRLWAQLLLGVIHLHGEKYKEGINLIYDFARKCPDDFMVVWANECPYKLSKEIIMSNEIYKRLQKRENRKAVLILHESLKHNPDDQKSLDLLSFALKRTGGRKSDEKAIRKVIQEPISKEINNQAQVAIARYYFINNQFGEAQKICHELLNEEIDSKIELDTKMILLSVGRKLNKR